MKMWVRILPLFIISWLARRRCEKFVVQGKKWHLAFPDVLIRSQEKK